MGKSTHFFGQPIYGQLIKLLDKSKIISSALFGLGKGIAAQHCCCEKVRSKK